MLLLCSVAINIWDCICRLSQHDRELKLRRPQLRSCWQIIRVSGDPPHGLQAPRLQLRIAARGRRQGLPTGAASASKVVHALRTAVSRDWQRVVAGDPAVLASGICCTFRLQGRHPSMSRERSRPHGPRMGPSAPWQTLEARLT